ncbi:MAG: hypothetical protein NC097_03845 [Clostridium sp.]|nr:hypothetical protein [Prevotella sp.]MCM1428910.1 hypothetical protein [Clostridium sp.]MCM1475289.1 hypothetical protein [Muribaculaceae bacterium]
MIYKNCNSMSCEPPRLVVMLTYNDFTVDNAEEIFDQCRDSKAQFWGMKESPLSIDRMKSLYMKMRDSGKTTLLEVVCYDEESGMRGAEIAAECGVDILMGTMFYPSIAKFCKSHNIKYMPFVGDIEGRPSVLKGEMDGIVRQAEEAIRCGADGIDILGYRYEGDPVALNKTLVKGCPADVCIAGSIDSFQRLDEVRQTGAWGFTIGSAFFDNKFGGSFAEQINKVVDYLNSHIS